MSENAWGFKMVERLLPHWRDLSEGYWPREPSGPVGYRGTQVVASGGFERAIEASVDFEIAVERLCARGEGNVARAVVRRYWEGRQVPWRTEELVRAVLRGLVLEPVAPRGRTPG